MSRSPSCSWDDMICITQAWGLCIPSDYAPKNCAHFTAPICLHIRLINNSETGTNNSCIFLTGVHLYVYATVVVHRTFLSFAEKLIVFQEQAEFFITA